MNSTILFCSLVFFITLMSANDAKDTFPEIYNRFLKLENEHTLACRQENNLSEETVQAIAIQISENGVIPEKREHKCFLTCMLLKAQDINEKGELLVDNVKPQSDAIHVTFLEKLMLDCISKIHETDLCEKGVRIQECFVEEVNLQLSKQ